MIRRFSLTLIGFWVLFYLASHLLPNIPVDPWSSLARASWNGNTREISMGMTIATLAMLLEAALIVFLFSRGLFFELFPLWIGLPALGMIFMFLSKRHKRSDDGLKTQVLSIGFKWKDALRLTLILSAMLTLVALAKFTLGETSVKWVS